MNKEPMICDRHMLVKLYPEMISASFLRKESYHYNTWVILKNLDVQGTGSGHLNVLDEMLPLFVGLLGVKTSQAYRKLEEGIGKYWNKPAGKKGERTTSLISSKKVTQYLSPQMARVNPFMLKLEDLFGVNSDFDGWKYLRSLLISIVAARFADGRPVSYATIQEHTGLSRSTIHRNLELCPHLSILENFDQLKPFNTYWEASNELREMIKQSGKRNNPWLVSAKLDGKYYIMQQLPNTYILGIDRGALNQRPKELKHFDKANSENCDERRYFANSKVALNKKNGFVINGNTKYDGKTIFVWNHLDNPGNSNDNNYIENEQRG